MIQQSTDEGVVSPPGLRLGHRWIYRQYKSQSVFNNLCRSFSMALLYRCFKHVLPWTMGRRETYLWFQAVKAKLLLVLNHAVDGWSGVSPSRTCGFQGTGRNFFTTAPTRSNSSLDGSDTAVPPRTRYLHHYEQRNDCWSCRSWR